MATLALLVARASLLVTTLLGPSLLGASPAHSVLLLAAVVAGLLLAGLVTQRPLALLGGSLAHLRLARSRTLLVALPSAVLVLLAAASLLSPSLLAAVALLVTSLLLTALPAAVLALPAAVVSVLLVALLASSSRLPARSSGLPALLADLPGSIRIGLSLSLLVFSHNRSSWDQWEGHDRRVLL